MKTNILLYLMLASTGGLFLFILTTDFPHHGTLTLRPAACSLAKSAGAEPTVIDAGCTLESKYIIGRSFTELRLPNKQRLLINNADVNGIVMK